MTKNKISTYYWTIVLGVIALIYCILTQTSLFFSSVILSGILCVSLTALGRKEAFLLGLYNSFTYAWIAYNNGLFGELTLNIFFYVPTGIIGYFLWKKKSNNGVVSMRRLTAIQRIQSIGLVIILIIIGGKLLSFIPSQNAPYIDAATNILTIAATLLMMGRYSDQWIMFITVNVLTIIMWNIRMEGYGGEAMIVMWSLYLLNSIVGYIRWNKIARVDA